MNRNRVYWGTQATVDYGVKMSDTQIREFCQLLQKENLGGDMEKALGHALQAGHGDIEIKKIPQGSLKVAKDILRQIVPEEKWDERGGGSPFYATLSGSRVGKSMGYALFFPEVKYNGIMVKSLEDLIDSQSIDRNLFSFEHKNEATPGTLALEGAKYKLMLANSDGRDLEDLDFDKYVRDLKGTAQMNKESIILVALAGLNKGTPDTYRELIKMVKGAGENIKVFVGTNSFGYAEGETQEVRDKRIRQYYELLKLADFVSMNDNETNDLYNAAFKHRDIPLAEKFLALDFNGARVTHSAEGALFFCNIRPEDLFDESVVRNFPSTIQKFLQWSVDGTSLAYQEGILPNFSLIQCYSENIRERQRSPFDVRFLVNKEVSKTRDAVPNGIAYAVAPAVTYPKGGLTGLGAVFDGLLTSFSMASIGGK